MKLKALAFFSGALGLIIVLGIYLFFLQTHPPTKTATYNTFLIPEDGIEVHAPSDWQQEGRNISSPDYTETLEGAPITGASFIFSVPEIVSSNLNDPVKYREFGSYLYDDSNATLVREIILGTGVGFEQRTSVACGVDCSRPDLSVILLQTVHNSKQYKVMLKYSNLTPELEVILQTMIESYRFTDKKSDGVVVGTEDEAIFQDLCEVEGVGKLVLLKEKDKNVFDIGLVDGQGSLIAQTDSGSMIGALYYGIHCLSSTSEQVVLRTSFRDGSIDDEKYFLFKIPTLTIEKTLSFGHGDEGSWSVSVVTGSDVYYRALTQHENDKIGVFKESITRSAEKYYRCSSIEECQDDSSLETAEVIDSPGVARFTFKDWNTVFLVINEYMNGVPQEISRKEFSLEAK